MAGLILPRRGIVKPAPGSPVNRSSPIAQGIVSAIPFSENNGNRIYDAGLGLYGAVVGLAPWVNTPRGIGLRFVAGSSHVVEYDNNRAEPWNRSRNISAVVLVRREVDAAYQSIINVGHNGWCLRFTNGNKIEILDANIAVVLTGATNVLSDGVVHTVGFTVDSAATGTVRLFLDGNQDATTTTTSDLASVVHTNKKRIGAQGNSSDVANTFLSGTVVAAFVWARSLTAAEMREVHLDPWQVFAAPRLWVIDIPAGGTDATGTVTAGTLPFTGTSTSGSAGAGATGTVSAGTLPFTGTTATGTAGEADSGTVAAGTLPFTGTATTANAGQSAEATIVAGQLPFVGTATDGSAGQADTGTVAAGTLPFTGTSASGSVNVTGTVAAGTLPFAGTTASGSPAAGVDATGTVNAGTLPFVGTDITSLSLVTIITAPARSTALAAPTRTTDLAAPSGIRRP